MTTFGAKRKPSLNFCQNTSLASKLSLEQAQIPNDSQTPATGFRLILRKWIKSIWVCLYLPLYNYFIWVVLY